jgi:S1-C subfamily serine protease
VKSTEKKIRTREVGIAPLAKRVLKSVFTVETDQGLGTGFAAWREGGSTYVLTAYHVVEDHIGPFVVLRRKGGNWSAEIAGTDPKHDLALLTISGQPANAEPLWERPVKKRPQTGDQLLLVGSPFGLEGTVTTGVVSRVTKKYVQTDAAANPGNSGGPAMSRTGQIVGVLVAGGGQNINFVVPIENVCAKLRAC